MLKKNRAVSPVKNCIAGNAMNIPLQTASLDILLAVGLLEYVKDKARALKEIDRVLKPGSFAVLTFSPKNFYTILRLIWGNRIYATTDSENEALLSKKFEITAQKKTLMQRQYLIKKP
jgi:ubiquinone/menaquinone biosynthesis C-methylase UbiE